MASNGGGSHEWPSHYDVVDSISSGTFGSVIGALDKRNNTQVAIKKVFTNFSVADRKGKPVLALRAIRELLLLWSLREHRNVLSLFDVFSLPMDILCMVTNRMGMDLKNAIEKCLITPENRPVVTYNIMCGIKYLHSAQVLHRNLKPSHIGITFDEKNNVVDVRLLDFGQSRKLKVEMSYVVQTAWYRAPEVWLQPGRYDKAIDLWSLGCIMAEMISGHVLIPGGTSFGAQLQAIARLLGFPREEFLLTLDPSYQALFEKFRNAACTTLLESLPKATGPELEILDKIFLWNPENRWNAVDCLKHPYFSTIRNAENEKEFKGELFDQSFEDRVEPLLDKWKEWFDEKVEDIKRNLTSENQLSPSCVKSS